MRCIYLGGGFPAVGLALQDGIGPSQLIAMRFIIAAIGMAFVFRKHLCQIKRIDLIAGAIAGACLFIGFAFQTTAFNIQQHPRTPLLHRPMYDWFH